MKRYYPASGGTPNGPANEACIVYSKGPTEGKIACIYSHGLLGGPDVEPWVFGDTGVADDIIGLTNLGLVVLFPLLSSTVHWSNDTSLGRSDTCFTWANTNLGTLLTPRAFAGESMGGLWALNAAWRREQAVSGSVAFCWVRVPTVALGATYTNVVAFRGTMEAAYTNLAGFNAGLPTHDPSHVDMIPLQQALSDRILCTFRTSDEFMQVALTRAWALSVGCEAREYPGNHAAGYSDPVGETLAWIHRKVRMAS